MQLLTPMNWTLPGMTIATWASRMGPTTAWGLLGRDLKARSQSGPWSRRLRGLSQVGPRSDGSTSIFEDWSRSRHWSVCGKSAPQDATGRASLKFGPS
jgi:hypothetical protein